MKIVCIGDSLTYGYGVYTGEGWVDLLSQNSDFKIINQGKNGNTTSAMLCRSNKDVVAYEPSYVIIMAGTNDMLMGYPINNIQDNISLLISEAKNNNIIPIIAIQPPVIASMAKRYWDKFIDYKKVNDALIIYRNWVLEITQNNIICIDFYKLIIDNIKSNNESYLYTDGIHLNKNGHKLLFQKANNQLLDIINY